MQELTHSRRMLGFGVAAAAVAFAIAMVFGAVSAHAETFVRDDTTDGTSVYSSSRAYIVEGNVLYREIGGSKKKLKKLPISGDAYWSISAAYKNNVYVTKHSFDAWKLWTYVFNTKTKKFKKARTSCDIVAFKGAYAYAMHDYKSDVSANRLDIYKMTNAGLKHVKKLTKYGFAVAVVGKKVYYTVSDGLGMHKTTLYKAKLNGTGKKRIVSIKSNQEYGQSTIYDITSKNCKLWADSKQYLYTYKTKKKVRID